MEIEITVAFICWPSLIFFASNPNVNCQPDCDLTFTWLYIWQSLHGSEQLISDLMLYGKWSDLFYGIPMAHT